MKFQGKVINWNDDKGYGFVEPNGGGERAFVHIKAFKTRSRRPVNGEVIVYKLVRGKNKRYKAENIKFSRDTKKSKKIKKGKNNNLLGSIFTIVFFISLVVSLVSGKLPLIVISLYIAMSFITFIAYAFDKSAANNGSWRTQESTLHLLSLIGGWPGAFFAQIAFRHKTSKKEFRNVYWVTVILNICGLLWFNKEEAINFLNSAVYPLLNS